MELHRRVPQQGAVPPPLGETSDTRNPKDVLHTVNIAIMIVVLCLTTPLFGLRMYVRSIILRKMGREECKSHLTLIFFPLSNACHAASRDWNSLIEKISIGSCLVAYVGDTKISAKSSSRMLKVNKISLLSYWVFSIFSEPTRGKSHHMFSILT